MTDTVVTPETVFQSLEIGEEKIAIVKEKSVQVVTVGTSPFGLTGSFNISIGGSYGGVFNIRLVNGLVQKIGIYGM